MTTGDKIRELRISKGMTQAELGAKIGVQFAAINKYEKGIVVNLKRSVIEKLAVALDTTPSYLMGFDEEEVMRQAARDAVILKEIDKDEDLKELIQMYLALPEGKKKTIKRMVEDYYNDFA